MIASVGRRRSWPGLLLLLALACNGGAGSEGERTTTRDRQPGDVDPGDAEGFLLALRPLPSSTLRVEYDVDGPGSMKGTLEIRAREGGWRRQDWYLTLPAIEGQPLEVRGTVIETPSWTWIGVDDQPGKARHRGLEDVAQGYLALEPEGRAKVMKTVRQWHMDLEAARSEHPGDSEELLGVRCLLTRIAGQTLCMWEAAGLPLRYEAAAFSVRATAIHRDETLADDQFVPSAGTPASIGGDRVDAKVHLDALARGDYAPIAKLTAARLSLPEPTTAP